MTYQILKGNNLDLLPTLADNSIDSIVTDPPYELGFMGKKWDNSGIAYSVELWQQCLRVLKPGGHLLAFSGSRTYHRMVVAIEDAGFEIRDMISWISNKTFPKSQNIAKAIDEQAGARGHVAKGFLVAGEYNNRQLQGPDTAYQDPALVTQEAKQWVGWGTGLKPTVEPIVMARKPVEGTIANNVLTYGTGGLNIDGSRIAGDIQSVPQPNTKGGVFSGELGRNGIMSNNTQGRWPANIILDPYTAELLDEQSGQVKGNPGAKQTTDFRFMNDADGKQHLIQGDRKDIGGASRFFYVAKASKRDRNEGLEITNSHPTVKPTDLMRYLVKLVTPPNGTVLDPFTGSGSTGKAAILEGFDFIGIEMTEDYWPIIEGRLKHAEQMVAERIKETANQEQEKLF
jgi:site-specific DNA-methyltransferase (adenine-specific)